MFFAHMPAEQMIGVAATALGSLYAGLKGMIG